MGEWGEHHNDHKYVPLEVGMRFLKEDELPTVKLLNTHTHTPTQTHTHKDIIGKGPGGRWNKPGLTQINGDLQKTD